MATKEPSANDLKYCSDKQEYLGKNALGKPICVSTARYRNVDKQIAYEKAKEQGIPWSGSYRKDEITGEVTPKTPEEAGVEIAYAKQLAESGVMPEMMEDGSPQNFIKKYWILIAAAALGIYLITSKD